MEVRHLGSFNFWLVLLGSIVLGIELNEVKDLGDLGMLRVFEEVDYDVECCAEVCATGDELY